MRKQPSIPTIKKLFALSGNLCAFPKCDQHLIDEANNILCEICHIEAAEPGGERYNSNQTDEERRSFENLILLCRRDHVVTNDVVKYTVPILKKMKASHEKRFQKHPFAIDDKTAQAAQQTLVIISVAHAAGSNVLGQGQQIIQQTFNMESPSEIELELTVIDEIFSYALNHGSETVSSEEIDGSLLALNKKLRLNFANESEREEVAEYFRLAYLKLTNIEARFSALRTDQQKDITSHILGCYKKLAHKGLSKIAILHDLFDEFVPGGKKGNPAYTNLSKAFVLMFFEDCTVFDKTESEKPGRRSDAGTRKARRPKA